MNQRGMALLVVLLMVATMATVAVSTQEYWQRAFSRAESQQFRQQAKWTLLGAEDLVRLQLLATLPAEPVHNGQSWALTSQTFQLDDIQIAYRLRDAQACFNLNAITAVRPRVVPTIGEEPAAPARQSYSQRTFRQLLLNQGVEVSRADGIITALAAQPRLLDVSQLRALPNIDQTLWQRLQPLVCTLPNNRLRININTLSGVSGHELLFAMLHNQLSRPQVQALLTSRPNNGWQQMDQLTMPEAALSAFAEMQSSSTLGSDYFDLLLWVNEAPHIYQLHSRLQRTEQGFQVTERRYGISEF